MKVACSCCISPPLQNIHTILIPPMSSCWAKKRFHDEGHDLDKLDTSDSEEICGSSSEDIQVTQGKKRTKLELSNMDVIRSITIKKLQMAPKGTEPLYYQQAFFFCFIH